MRTAKRIMLMLSMEILRSWMGPCCRRWISSAAAARVRTCPWLEREPDYLAPALAFLWNRSGW